MADFNTKKTNSAVQRSGFTLIELLVVVFIIAVLSAVIVYVINLPQLFKQSRDGERISDLYTISKALDYYQQDTAATLGTPNTIYLSLADPSATSSAGDQCQGLGIPSLPSGYTYHCSASSTYRKTDGTGWIPLNLNAQSGKAPISAWPLDPTNQSSTNEYYAYATDGISNYEVTANLEASKNQATMLNDGGQISNLYEMGTAFGFIPIDYSDTTTIYVADTSNNRIEKIQGNGNYISQFGGAGSGNGQMYSPSGLAFDSSGNLYVVDSGNRRIEKFDANGNYLLQFGSTGSGNGQFNGPQSIAVDSNNQALYVTDTGNNRIEKFDLSGNYLTQWGTYGTSTSQFNAPFGVAVYTTTSTISVYVTDTGNNRVQIFSSNGGYISQFGGYGSGNGQFWLPHGVITDSSGNVYVVDAYHGRIQKFNSSGTYISQFKPVGDQAFNDPFGIGLDLAGNIYVSDTNYARIEKFDPNGNFISQIGSYGTGNGQVQWPDDAIIRLK